jgi:DNA polymerase-3 subunit delta
LITWDLRKLQQRLENHPPSMLYVLAGDEAFLHEEALALIKSKSVDPGTIDFNYDSFYAGETKAAQVKDAVQMLPMMSPRRLVIFRNVDDMKDKEWDELFDIFEMPVESTTLVLTCEALDKRKKPYKKLAEHAVWVDLKRPYDNQIPDWIDYLAYRKQMEVSKEAGQLIKQFVGVNLTEINNELEKLRNYVGERKNVAVEDVLAIVSRARVDRIFDLTDAIGKNDKASALHSLANLLEHGQNEVGALAMITRHIRILALLKEGQREGLSGPRLCAKVGIPQFLLTQYLDQTRSWTEGKLSETIEILHKTDRALKSSSLPSHVWLENFILQTC